MQFSGESSEILRIYHWAVRCLEAFLKPLLVLLFLGAIVYPGNSPLLAQSSSSPQELKRQALAELEQVSTSQRSLQRIIKRATKNVHESLEHKGHSHFLDGYRILPPPEGEKVFREERKAVQWLILGLRLRRTPEEIKIVLSRVIDNLVEADRIIAEISIALARQLVQAGVGDVRKLEEAQRDYERALGETNPRKAIQRFREAWESSQEVVDGRELVIKDYNPSPDPFSPSLTSNTLSATFLIHLKRPFHSYTHPGKKYHRDDDDDDGDKKDWRGNHYRPWGRRGGDDDDDRDNKNHKEHDQSHEHRKEPLTLEFIEIIQTPQVQSPGRLPPNTQFRLPLQTIKAT